MVPMRTLTTSQHAVRLALLALGLAAVLAGNAAGVSSVGWWVAILLLWLTTLVAMGPAERQRLTATRVPAWQAALIVLLSVGVIPLCIWLNRSSGEGWKRPVEWVMRHPAFVLGVWAGLVGFELWLWRRSSRVGPA